MRETNHLKCIEKTIHKKEQKGITLVALVITIIVLLILAGVTINIAINTGIMEKSENAVDRYVDQQQVEAGKLDTLDKDFGELSGIKDNTEGTEHTKMIEDKDYSYKNPVIPAGFKTSSDGANWAVRNGEEVTGWDEGLVIEDKDGNQFVWVPACLPENEVEGVAKYEKWLGPKNHEDITSLDQLSDDTLPNGITNEEDQITIYGGFYIGRYEAGIPSALETAITTANATARNVPGTPVVKKNQVPWNYIDYNKSKTNAESMYDTTKVKSGLLTGTMWDTTMKWLKNSGVNVETDSSGWANYVNVAVTGITQYSSVESSTLNVGASWTSVSSITKPTIGTNEEDYIWLLKTGNSEYTKRKNIYDLAGNLWEHTNELYNENSQLIRGGGFWSINGYCKGGIRLNRSQDFSDCAVGFRVSLYIQ